MTQEEIQEFAVKVSELIDAKFLELKAEIALTRQAAERAANIGHDLITRIDVLETKVEKQEIRIRKIERDYIRVTFWKWIKSFFA